MINVHAGFACNTRHLEPTEQLRTSCGGNRPRAGALYSNLNAAFPAAIEIMWGHILYRHRDLFAKKNQWLVWIGTFLLCNVLRARIQMYLYQGGSTSSHIRFWYSSIGLICAVCVVAFGLSLIRNRRATALNRGICGLASLTFTVYLFHGPVINALDLLQLRLRLYAFFESNIPIIGAAYFLYAAAIILVIAEVTFTLAGLLRLLKKVAIHVTEMGGLSAFRAET